MSLGCLGPVTGIVAQNPNDFHLEPFFSIRPTSSLVRIGGVGPTPIDTSRLQLANGVVACRERLGGLLKFYHREAA